MKDSEAIKLQDRFEILLEHLHTKMDIVLEALTVVRQDVKVLKTDTATIKDDVDGLKVDMKVVKRVVREHSRELAQLNA